MSIGSHLVAAVTGAGSGFSFVNGVVLGLVAAVFGVGAVVAMGFALPTIAAAFGVAAGVSALAGAGFMGLGILSRKVGEKVTKPDPFKKKTWFLSAALTGVLTLVGSCAAEFPQVPTPKKEAPTWEASIRPDFNGVVAYQNPIQGRSATSRFLVARPA